MKKDYVPILNTMLPFLNLNIPYSGQQVHVVWNLGLPEGDKPGEAGLRVTPLEADVPAKTTFMFRLGLFPTKSNCYFSEEAEAFVSPSNQMTFRCVKFSVVRGLHFHHA